MYYFIIEKKSGKVDFRFIAFLGIFFFSSSFLLFFFHSTHTHTNTRTQVISTQKNYNHVLAFTLISFT